MALLAGDLSGNSLASGLVSMVGGSFMIIIEYVGDKVWWYWLDGKYRIRFG